MTGCSKRRKTKYPYCNDDPRCYWKNNTCKNKKLKQELSTNNVKKLSKLDIILKKLSTIENQLIVMNKKNISKKMSNYKYKPRPRARPIPKTKKIHFLLNNKNNSTKNSKLNNKTKKNALNVLKHI
tara:strand:- start:41233 stop:41610 length:378 start_codon:yes stop_codon:yes gene_type:complete